MFILGIGVAIVTAGWEEIQRGNFIYLFVYLFALVFGAIGFVDDFQKLRHHANEGLTALQKFLLQLAAAALAAILIQIPHAFKKDGQGTAHRGQPPKQGQHRPASLSSRSHGRSPDGGHDVHQGQHHRQEDDPHQYRGHAN